jgi:uncharacterized protein YcfL
MKRLSSLLLIALVLSGCTSSPTAVNQEVEIFFVADSPQGFKLFSEVHSISQSDANLSTQVLSELISGEIQPYDPDYVNLWGSANSLNELSVDGDLATVDINLAGLNVGSESEIRAIEQIVWTLTGIDSGIKSVKFLVNGESVESFAGHVDTTGLFSRGADYEVLSGLQITSIQEAEVLDSPVTVLGQACTFEGTVNWKLLSSDTVVDQGSLTASGACPIRSSWELDLGELEPGAYKIEVFELSAEDGSTSALDNKEFQVR